MKRFTDTEKWADPWFRKLTLTHKLLWDYICSKCDIAGVWKPDLELASFCIGNDLCAESALKDFEGRVEVLPSGRWLIVKFIPFQYGELSPDCRPHQAVIKLLGEDGIGYAKGILRVSDTKTISISNNGAYDKKHIGYAKGIDTLKDKYKDKDKDKDRGVQGGERKKFTVPSLEEVKLFCAKSGIPENDAQWFFEHEEGNGWTNGGKPVKNWRMTLLSWKRMAYLPSQRAPASSGKFQRNYHTSVDAAQLMIENFKPDA